MAGCRFARRCPVAQPRCWDQTPPLYHTDPNRAVACFVYDSAPVTSSPDVAQVFARNGERPGAPARETA
jgi:hypothetical protein